MRKIILLYCCIFALLTANQSCRKDSNSISQLASGTANDQLSADTLIITDSSLLCYLPFSSNLRDKSGHRNNGKLVGTISYVADRFGNPSKAASFAASNTYIEIPEADFVGLKTLTIAMDFYPTSSGRQILLSKMSYSQPIGSVDFYQSLILAIEQNNAAPIQFNTKKQGYCNSSFDGDWNTTLSSSTNFILNQWNHIAATFNSKAQKIYLNGNLVAFETKLPSPICQGEPIRLGVWWASDPKYYTGKMDEVRLYNRVLSGKEIKALWSSNN